MDLRIAKDQERFVAAKLYHDFGFMENGEKDDEDEIVAVLEL